MCPSDAADTLAGAASGLLAAGPTVERPTERSTRPASWQNRVVNVLLDLDGTLTDPRVGIVACLQHALHRLGRPCPPPADLVAFIGPPLRESFGRLLDTDEGSAIDEAVTLYRERFAAIGLFENIVYQGVPEALAELRGLGMTLYVATSKAHTFARRIVEHFGLGSFFAGVYGSELDGTRADKAELIAHVLQREALASTSTVMVGDRAHDVRGARARGVFPVGVLWGYGSRAELTSAGAGILCERPALLPALLRARADLEVSVAPTGAMRPRRGGGRLAEERDEPVGGHGQTGAQRRDGADGDSAGGGTAHLPQVDP